MSRVTKIAISLPEEVLSAVEREREGSGESRSQFFRRAAEMALRQKQDQIMSERYVQAYREIPETSEEVEASRRSAAAILAEEPWQ